MFGKLKRLLYVGNYTLRADDRPVASRTPVRVDQRSFSKVMEERDLSLSFSVPDRLSGAEGAELPVSLRIRGLANLEPANVAKQVPALARLLEARMALAAPRGRLGGEAGDQHLGRQMEDILHHPLFLRLEAAWRGLRRLVESVRARVDIRIDILDCDIDDLLYDLEESPRMEDWGLYRLVSGAPRDKPFTAILADCEIGPDPASMSLLEKCASVAAATGTVFLAAAAPTFFDLRTWPRLSGLRDPRASFDRPAFRRFLLFRETAAARRTALLMPPILLRPRFGRETAPVRAFDYEESGDFSWGNPIFAFGPRLVDTFLEYGVLTLPVGTESAGGPKQSLADLGLVWVDEDPR